MIVTLNTIFEGLRNESLDPRKINTVQKLCECVGLTQNDDDFMEFVSQITKPKDQDNIFYHAKTYPGSIAKVSSIITVMSHLRTCIDSGTFQSHIDFPTRNLLKQSCSDITDYWKKNTLLFEQERFAKKKSKDTVIVDKEESVSTPVESFTNAIDTKQTSAVNSSEICGVAHANSNESDEDSIEDNNDEASENGSDDLKQQNIELVKHIQEQEDTIVALKKKIDICIKYFTAVGQPWADMTVEFLRM